VQFDYLWTGFSVLTGSLAITACLAVLVLASQSDRRLLALGLPTAIATPVLLWLLAQFTPLYAARYLLGAGPGIALLIAAAIVPMPKARAVALAAILLALVIPQQIAVRGSAGHDQDYRGAAELVSTDCSARIAHDYMSGDAMEYYLRQQSCAPSETTSGSHLWFVQAAGPQVAEPGYQLVLARTFGSAIVTYWVAIAVGT
jgi:hypothetical protein